MLKLLDIAEVSEHKKPEITLGFYSAYNCHSEAEVLIILRNESVVGYMNTSVNLFLNGYTVAVIVGNTIGKVHEIVKFVVVNFLCHDIFAVFSENCKCLIKCVMQNPLFIGRDSTLPRSFRTKSANSLRSASISLSVLSTPSKWFSELKI